MDDNGEYISHKDHTKAADDMAEQGAKASLAMSLTSFAMNIPFSAAVGLKISLWHQPWFAGLTETRCCSCFKWPVVALFDIARLRRSRGESHWDNNHNEMQ